MEKLIRDLGCLLMLISVVAGLGYLVNILMSALAPIDLALKVILLVGIAGFFITLGALIAERIREKKK